MDADYALFASIVDAGSLSAAGRRASISPAMVSKRLVRLEQRLGVRLIHRTTRRLVLTEAGQRFHADVVAILEHVRRAEERVSGSTREPSGPLRVSMPTSFGRLHVARHLHRFLDRFPKVELEANLSDTFVDLLTERVDVALRITAQVPASMTAHRLAASRRILCAAPAYLSGHGIPETIADLARHHLLAAEGQMPWRLVRGRERVSVEQESRVRTNSSEVIREIAVSGAGIALRSLWDVSSRLREGSLVRVLPNWEGTSDVGIYVVHHAGDGLPSSVAAFVAFMRDLLDPAPWGEPLS